MGKQNIAEFLVGRKNVYNGKTQKIPHDGVGGILIGEILVHPNVLESKKNIDSKKNQVLRVMLHTQHNEWLDFSPKNRQQN